MGADARLNELKLELPPAPKPVATYVTAVRHGDLLYVSGHGPLRSDGTMHVGKVGRLVKVLGMVNCIPDFGDQPKVINGFSDLMVEVFGEAGKGARSAVGMGALPGGIAVEIEAIFQVRD